MTKLNTMLARFVRDEDGAAAIEYALLLGLLTLAIIGAVTTLGENTNSSFVDFNTDLEAAKAAAG